MADQGGPAPRLRVFPPTGASSPYGMGNPVGENDSAGYWPLRRCWEESLSKKIELSPATLKHYRRLINQWEAYWRKRGCERPLGPDVREIQPKDFNDFARAQGWTAKSTWSTRRDYFGKILKSVARASKSCPIGLTEGWLFEQPPFLAPLPPGLAPKPETPEALTVDQFARLLECCDGARWPWRRAIVPAPVLWRAYLSFLWVYGSRKDAALRLTWREVDLERERLDYVPDKKADRVSVALHTLLLPLLHFLRDRSPDRVFPFPNTARTAAQENFNPQLKAIFRAAGLVEHTSHFFRVCCVTNWQTLVGRRTRFVTGHRPQGVQEKHYDSRSARQVIAERMAEYPMPPAETLWAGLPLEYLPGA